MNPEVLLFVIPGKKMNAQTRQAVSGRLCLRAGRRRDKEQGGGEDLSGRPEGDENSMTENL